MSMTVEQQLAELNRRISELEGLSRELVLAYEPMRSHDDEKPINGHLREAFDVVFVCSGNRFRSPIAEATLRQATDGLPVEVSSAGTLDLGPVPALPEAQKLADRFGLDLSTHRARSLVDVDLAGSDLVIGFEQAHVSMAVVEANAPRERTFTMFELVDLLEWIDTPEARDPVTRARETVARLDEARSLKLPGRAPELADPLGAAARVHRETAGRVRECAHTLAQALFGVRLRPEPKNASRNPVMGLLRKGLAAG